MKGFEIAAGLLESAVFNQRDLADVLADAGSALGFAHFSIVHDDLTRVQAIAAAHTLAVVDAYQAGGWLAADHRALALAQTPAGTLYVDDGASRGDARDLPPIVSEFFFPHGMATCAAWRFSVEGETWRLGLARHADAGPVTPDEQAQLRRLMPLANRALIAAHAVRQTRLDGMTALMTQLGVPGLIIDHAGRASVVSPEAERHFGADLFVSDGRLCAAHPESQQRLEALSALARYPAPDDTLDHVVIERAHGGWPILLRIMPVRDAGLDVLPGGRLLVTIEDRSAPLQPSETELRLAYGLSESEINIATLLAQGLTPLEIAARRKVVIGTVRMQIREIFAKMGARRIADVVAIVARYSRRAN